MIPYQRLQKDVDQPNLIFIKIGRTAFVEFVSFFSCHVAAFFAFWEIASFPTKKHFDHFFTFNNGG